MPKVIVFGVDGLSMPLMKRYAANGDLPNIAAMLAGGAGCELLPYISAWGDVNWVAFMAGQGLGTCWAGQSMPPDNTASANLLGRMAEKHLRAAMVHFPESIATAAPHASYAPYWGRGQRWPSEVFPPMGHTAELDERPAPPRQTLGWPPKAALAYHNKGAWKALTRQGEGYVLELAGHDGKRLTATLTAHAGRAHLRLGEHTQPLETGAWSPWLDLAPLDVPGSVRFYLGRFDLANNDVEILQSQVTHRQRLTDDPTLAAVAADLPGPFFSKWVMKASPDERYRQAAYDEAEDQSLWLAQNALDLTQRHGFSLWATVHRLVDESHHNCLGQCDPASPLYNPARAETFDQVMRECYQVLDRSLGKLMAEMDDDTVLMLASDHGAVPNAYMCDIYRYLETHGLVVLKANGAPDMGRSQVYLKDERGGLEIFVNLAGREPSGIVAQSDFDAVCAKTLLALGSWSVLDKGAQRNAVSLALLKDDAVGLGFWGPCAGDIIFAYNAGFVWGVSPGGEAICPVDAPGANHGPQKPTAETAMASNYGALVMYGAGIRRGYYRDRRALGPYRMIDPAATIAHLLGLPLDTLDGRVMHDLLAPAR